MSFEGYYQVLCKRGHLSTPNVYNIPTITKYPCPFCGMPPAWINMVDTTNGSFDDQGQPIGGYVELKLLARRRCSKCKTLELRYRNPLRKRLPRLASEQ